MREHDGGLRWIEDPALALLGLAVGLDPRRNQCTVLDVAVGWVVAIMSLAVTAIVTTIAPLGVASEFAVESLGGAGLTAMFAVVIGGVPLTIYGVPAAVALAVLLSVLRMRWEVVHLACFAALGAIVAWPAASLVDRPILEVLPYAIVAAVVGRLAGKRFAIARDGALRERLVARGDAP
ncbi:hypothetical protein [Agrococcus jejuensis]|uniref:Uncharacterized protein n=1 Tax=Agrococcus jejuensis TaxID=399736 RepID=A0A1G8GR86_9MICO|nr:hypothetical protein [Agrococcus jejuensis]SDH96857.1 hypothetical protein SAMN04489720_3036 [Agrococcus jejuensis]